MILMHATSVTVDAPAKNLSQSDAKERKSRLHQRIAALDWRQKY